MSEDEKYYGKTRYRCWGCGCDMPCVLVAKWDILDGPPSIIPTFCLFDGHKVTWDEVKEEKE